MENEIIEKRENYTIDNKKYNVIIRVTKERISKENLIKLIVNYGIQELQLKGTNDF